MSSEASRRDTAEDDVELPAQRTPDAPAPAEPASEAATEDVSEDAPEDAPGERDDGEAAGPQTGDDDPGAPEPDAESDPEPTARSFLPATLTALSAVLVLTALLLPNDFVRLTARAFLRIPVEPIFLAVLLLAVPARARRRTALAFGTLIGLITLIKFTDMGFYAALVRPFDLVFDWHLLSDGYSFLQDTLGPTVALIALVGIAIAVLAVPVLTALAVARLGDVLARHGAVSATTALALGTAWTLLALTGVHYGALKEKVYVATRNNAVLIGNRAEAVRNGWVDGDRFAKETRVDRFDGTPGKKLLPDLRGKNVIVAFVESYGRSAVEDPTMGPPVREVLEAQTKALDKDGYHARSGWLTSPVSGAGSWMGHSTLMSGLWVSNEQRYRSVVTSDRLTLTRAFRRTGDFRMVGIMPGVTAAWPEGEWYGMDHVYDSTELGYKGPKFSWSPVPDQFSLKAFERLEHGKKDHKPLMATIILATSHNPWAPLPVTLPWNKLGDGSVYKGIAARGAKPTEVWKDPRRVRAQYRKAIQYSVRNLTDYVREYGDDDTVLVFLGDHQPVPTVTRHSPNRDVPISVVARDDKVLDKIDDWGWTEGLKPAHKAPVWRMNQFRDRFLTAYGSEPETGAGKK
jgi:hypothetical protein